MRVIAGKARRLLLKTIDGLDTRPTTDRIKETLFNILNPDLPGSTFLDLFSGSGGIGIEALSRGADRAVFIEMNPKAAECIRENLQTTKFTDESIVMNCDVLTGLKRLEGKDYVFDFVFMDPPYGKELERQVLTFLSASPLISEDTLIIVEADLKTGFDYLESLGLECRREKIYKTNKHVFIAKGEVL
ncbi:MULTISPECIES: 16S rRNA (guanine(966)-N(2))-methyltransferase RsmD [Hungatella]|uniref:16S rRNA (guanine(966)-N(2))-methyltransferase RsmD n=1 Tax=Hungatella TaxID=1649459 RepID=UPI0021088350|nr:MULTISPECIES: 16S rRNA (guanine(966)-N(2))-methyltransferase RsmD [Hungatella]MCD7968346.1 16S rRNA (guanine(966)-N(2))-methyltransferase RsmD [Clostridiaceae bacterium]MCI6454518.1 16S rRNA (guanine(966)-N(2))-methyltransferase RsmD [Hungatella sp.]MCQ5383304.1 16S rRNA (guanine(966)-N(2))-methyltransferase RsmD [Hungatella hathewayi]